MRTTMIAAIIAISVALPDAGCAQDMDLGKNEYVRSCASCHGETGKGDGPTSKTLRTRPSDLTKLAKNNNEVFPLLRVYDVIDGRMQVIVHGTREMPVWGDVFQRELAGRAPGERMSRELQDALVRTRILALMEYMLKLQDK